MALPKLNVPLYELTLPSSNKKVKYRPFLVKEHKILLTMAEASDDEVGRIVCELVDACTFNALNVFKLPHFDIEYIFLQIRAKSIGEIVDVVVNCECGNKIETSFNIDDLEVEKDITHTNKILITDNVGIEMNYPVFKDIVKIFASKNSKDIFDLVIDCVKGIYDEQEYYSADDQTKEEIEEFVYSLTKVQFEKIEKFFSNYPKVVQIIESDCPECKKHNISRLEGLANFFV